MCGRCKGRIEPAFCRGLCARAFEVTLGDDNDAFRGPIPETDQCAGHRCSVPDRVANLGRGDLSPRVSATGQRIACKSNCAVRPFLTATAFSGVAVASFSVGNVSEWARRLAVHLVLRFINIATWAKSAIR